jgi:hypothetical protein
MNLDFALGLNLYRYKKSTSNTVTNVLIKKHGFITETVCVKKKYWSTLKYILWRPYLRIRSLSIWDNIPHSRAIRNRIYRNLTKSDIRPWNKHIEELYVVGNTSLLVKILKNFREQFGGNICSGLPNLKVFMLYTRCDDPDQSPRTDPAYGNHVRKLERYYPDMIKAFPLLETLKIDNLDNNTLNSFARGFRSLSNIIIWGSNYDESYGSSITQRGFRTFLRNVNHEQLTRISLARYRLEDGWVNELAYCARNLICINLSGCDHISDFCLFSLGIYCKQLTDINLSYCSRITNTGIVKLAEGCSRLSDVRLCDCVRISDDALIALATHCRSLSTIYVSCCRLITDAGLIAICAGGGDRLTAMYLDCLPRVSDAGISAIAEHCHYLISISLYSPNCRNITHTSIQMMLLSCRHLRYVCLPKQIPIVTDCYMYIHPAFTFRYEAHLPPTVFMW